MDHLWWYVPYATAPMLIALIATVHVFVSHYAVGGGIFLAAETAWAHKKENQEYLAYLKRHTQFFVLLTIVFGAITGVGIWWTIGLASPLATETLIRTFVFGWATEWVFFVVELAAAFLFFYLWDRLTPRAHTAIGWIYAGAAWGSLVLITGITAFMLDPGAWVKATQAGTEGTAFWAGFFNPQFLPQCTARTGAALMLATTYVLFHASWYSRMNPELQALVVRRTFRYAVAGVILTVLGIVWGACVLSDAARLSVMRAAALNIIFGAGMLASGMLLLMLILLRWRPNWLSPVAGVAVLLVSLGVLTAGEFLREAIRKPFVITECIYGNQIHVSQVEKLRENGLLESGRWTKPYMTATFPYLVDETTGKLDLEKTRTEDRTAVGKVIFMHHCNDCHASTVGYNGLALLSTSARKGELKELLLNLDSMIYYMPPWCGTETEAELLAEYLESVAEPHPFRKMEGEAENKTEPLTEIPENVSETAIQNIPQEVLQNAVPETKNMPESVPEMVTETVTENKAETVTEPTSKPVSEEKGATHDAD